MKEDDIIHDISEHDGIFDAETEGFKNVSSKIALFIIIVILMTSVGLNIFEINRRESYRRELDDKYFAALYQASEYVDDLLSQMDKAKLAKRPEQSAPIFADIRMKSALARDSLSQLPPSGGFISEAIEFFSSLTSLSHSLMIKSIDGDYLENDDWRKLAAAEADTSELYDELRGIITDTVDGILHLGHRSKKFSESSFQADDVVGSEDVSGLRSTDSMDIFSNQNHYSDGSIISADVGKTYAREFLNKLTGTDTVRDIIYYKTYYLQTASSEENIGVHSYSATLNGGLKINVDISAESGMTIMMLREYPAPSGELISKAGAIKIASEFLELNGYRGMRLIHYEIFGESIYVDFVFEEGGVTMYPDGIKVKLCLVDGGIEALNALSYHRSHRDRDIKRPLLNEYAVLELVSPQLQVRSIALAVITGSDGTEVLCYEFRGTLNGEYSVFINADNGRQELIKTWANIL